MVFGWGKKKKSENSSPSSEKKEISLNDIPSIVDEILKIRTSQMLSDVKSLRDDTEPLIKELAKIGQTLEKDNLAVDDIDKHLRIIVVRGKKQVIDAIKKDVTALPKASTFEEVENLNDTLNQILKKIGDVLGRQTRVIHIFAKKYAEKLKEILAQMTTNHAEIRQLIKNYNDTRTVSQEILDLLKTFHDHENEVKHNTQRISELKTELKSLENKISLLHDSIDNITSSNAYASFLELHQTLEELNSEKPKIKNQINSQFTKISRPLSRYEYVSSDKEQKNLLTKLIEDPIDILYSKNKDMIIVILENVRKGIISGSISVKDVDKSMAQITETEEMLDSFIKQVDEFRKKTQHIENQMNAFDRTELKKLQNDLHKAENEKEEHGQKITTFENEIAQTRSKIPVLLSEIESKLRNFSNIQYSLINPTQN